MTSTISASFGDQFSQTMHLLLQQKESKLRNLVRIEKANGENHYFDRLGNFTASEIVGRLQATDIQDAAHSRRMASVLRYGASVALDNIDKLKMLIDPTSDYARKLASAHGINFDVVVMEALVGTAATGRAGAGTAAFDSNNVIAESAAGFTVAKFNQALRLLEKGDVDLERQRVNLVIEGLAVEDLIGDSSNQLTSLDFHKVGGVMGPVLPSFRGVNIIRCNNVPQIDSNSFRGIMFAEDAVKVALAEDLIVESAKLPEKNFALLVGTYMMFGAVRMEEASVIDIRFA